MTAVAVWAHAPNADELLDARISAGWRPVPTATVNGPVIMGHAATRCTPQLGCR
ncbi:MAG: hypothetical protein AAF799_17740 [Myxococcota bacterium]